MAVNTLPGRVQMCLITSDILFDIGRLFVSYDSASTITVEPGRHNEPIFIFHVENYDIESQ